MDLNVLDYQISAYVFAVFRAVVVLLVCLGGIYIIASLLAKLMAGLKRELCFIEITPLYNQANTPQSTEQLLASIHALLRHASWWAKFFRVSKKVSLEIVSTKSDGIRYLICCDKSDEQSIRHLITSYSGNSKMRLVDDYSHINEAVYLEFRQSAHFAYPLKANDQPSSHDPISYITNAMTKLHDNELMAVQYTLTPIVSREAQILNHKIMTNENLMPKLNRSEIPVFSWIGSTVASLLFFVTDIISDIIHNGRSYAPRQEVKDHEHDRQVAKGVRPARMLSHFEQELVAAISDKLSQQLFKADIRVLIYTPSKERLATRRNNIKSAFDVFMVPKYQRLKLRSIKGRVLRCLTARAYQERNLSLLPFHQNTLSATEVSSLYHVPYFEVGFAENMVASLSKVLPAPLSLKNSSKLDVILGQNVYHNEKTLIGLTAAERERHMYILGGTGNGKTTMMEYAIVQDIQKGKGVAVLDPHGDLAEKLLGYIPEKRIKDVIYFNPSDLGYPIGLNLLELPEGLEGDALIDAKDFITEAVISVMRKIFSDDDSGGHRIEYMLRNAIQTALTQPDATLFTIYDLLTDARYRNKVTRTLKDMKLKNFWREEFGRAGAMQKVKMAAGVTAKIGRFQFSASAERILSQQKSTIDFSQILDGKILICNLAKGLIGEDTSELFGISVLAKLQLAAYQRVKIDRENRKSFYIYVDEFQNFATMSFVQLLSEARKYKVFLTMAEQSTSQQDEQKMVNTILANVGTVICFRSGNPADEAMMLPLFSPYVSAGEIANLPTYNFYARLAAVHSQEPLSGETLLLETARNDAIAGKVVASSRQQWARQYEHLQTAPTKAKNVTVKKPADTTEPPSEFVSLPSK